jgi:beta-lysine 5,6-aminomutase beta subunit
MNEYKKNPKDFITKRDLTKIKPYGDTMNDGKVQLSFTFPITDGDRAVEAARLYVKKMGFNEVDVVHHHKLDDEFTFFIVYGTCKHTINYDDIHVQTIEIETMSLKETDQYIKKYIGRPIVVVGATTGTDAHTVGIDAIMNMKGYAGHYGLERYEMIEAHNLGAQVLNEDFIKKAVELNADVLLVSQTVTQKRIHIKNLTELIEMLEAEGIRDQFLVICGGPRITNDLAKELGFDAGFGPGKYADDVATFIAKELYRQL